MGGRARGGAGPSRRLPADLRGVRPQRDPVRVSARRRVRGATVEPPPRDRRGRHRGRAVRRRRPDPRQRIPRHRARLAGAPLSALGSSPRRAQRGNSRPARDRRAGVRLRPARRGVRDVVPSQPRRLRDHQHGRGLPLREGRSLRGLHEILGAARGADPLPRTSGRPPAPAPGLDRQLVHVGPVRRQHVAEVQGPSPARRARAAGPLRLACHPRPAGGLPERREP